jgi:hypothetical protein
VHAGESQHSSAHAPYEVLFPVDRQIGLGNSSCARGLVDEKLKELTRRFAPPAVCHYDEGEQLASCRFHSVLYLIVLHALKLHKLRMNPHPAAGLLLLPVCVLPPNEVPFLQHQPHLAAQCL